jgi:hypothetical protein
MPTMCNGNTRRCSGVPLLSKRHANLETLEYWAAPGIDSRRRNHLLYAYRNNKRWKRRHGWPANPRRSHCLGGLLIRDEKEKEMKTPPTCCKLPRHEKWKGAEQTAARDRLRNAARERWRSLMGIHNSMCIHCRYSGSGRTYGNDKRKCLFG